MDKILRIIVGTMNPAKLEAVKEILQDYSHLKDATVVGVKANSGVSEQPKTLDETISGAMNRARGAFSDCTYSFGIESGLFPVPHTKSGYMDVCAVAIYDGKDFHLGLSSRGNFPIPRSSISCSTKGLI